MTGTLLKGIGGFYYVLGSDGTTYTLRAQSKIRHERLKPLVGDGVEFIPGDNDSDGWLLRILERKNSFIRPPVANVDALVVAISASVPQADLLLCDRLMLIAKANSIRIFIAVTKSDDDGENASALLDEYSKSGASVYRVSAFTGEGAHMLKDALKGCVHAFAGQSGAGKSSLINSMYGFELDVGDISERISRGKHTTRACSLIPLPGGGAVVDTPGFSLLESELTEPEKIGEYYAEFAPYAESCRFSPCVHISEPGCAVKQALNAGLIPVGRYERYKLLYAEMKERWNKRYD
ncbi:MAG: ribosome small subunit-dependent GTPase A [Clostridia bacterium]|nr:ribosome small subunit-dependent GTPase A [Clostridia bacterium]